MTPLLEVRDIAVRYKVRTPLFCRQRYLYAVNGISFTLEKGETLGLVGESGCGKSTLGRALVKLETPYRGGILLDGRDLVTARGKELKELRKKFQMIFQDPYGSLNPRLNIFSALDEVIALHFPGSRSQRLERAAELMEKVGLSPEALSRYPHQFSGGQRQRIGIARALAAEPEFIVADEPVSALDVSVQASIVNLLQDIQKESGTALLFIAHDLAVVEHISTRIMVMYLGNAVELAPSRQLAASPRHPYTQALLNAVPNLDKRDRHLPHLTGDVPSPLAPPAGCPFHPRCPYASEQCRKEKPFLQELPGEAGRFCACWHPLTNV
ncbi:MAG: ATP-binding cassette domain-containing protein [Lentisphaeria bacterium]|nr:ATP-binding cassette domain-containing protein [Lentisphaeria bacterium]